MVRLGNRWVHMSEAGTPDLYIVGRGWLEVKLPGKNPTLVQERWHARAASLGVRTAVARSVEEALDIANMWALADGRRVDGRIH